MRPVIVPTFLEKESHILGPLTFRQLVIVCAGGIIVVLVKYLYEQYLIPVAAIVMPIAATIAFLKINDIPAPEYFLKVLNFHFQKKMYFWSKIKKVSEKEND